MQVNKTIISQNLKKPKAKVSFKSANFIISSGVIPGVAAAAASAKKEESFKNEMIKGITATLSILFTSVVAWYVILKK